MSSNVTAGTLVPNSGCKSNTDEIVYNFVKYYNSGVVLLLQVIANWVPKFSLPIISDDHMKHWTTDFNPLVIKLLRAKENASVLSSNGFVLAGMKIRR